MQQGVYQEKTGAQNPYRTYFSDFTNHATLAFDDINGDGRMDFIIQDSGNYPDYYTQNTDGTFRHANEIVLHDNPGPFDALLSTSGVSGMRPSFADVDGDGRTDLVGGPDNATMVYAKKNTSGLFVVQTGNDNPFRTVTGWVSPGPALANLDSDSDLELVIAGSSHTQYFDRPKTYDKGTDDSNNVVYKPMAEDSDPFRSLIVEEGIPYFMDADGDGDKDLLIGAEDGTILYGLNINKEWLFFR